MRTIIAVIVISLSASSSLFSQWEAHIKRNGIRFNASTENLLILNHFDEPLSNVDESLYLLAKSRLENDLKGNYAALAQDKTFSDFCEYHDILHLGGPMLGNVSEEGVDVWLRTAKPAEVSLMVQSGDKRKIYGPVQSTLDSDLTAVVPVRGLAPGKKYSYKVLVDGVLLDLKISPEFKTLQKDPRAETRIAFGSCAHRMGLGNVSLSNTIVKREPDAMLLIGDMAANDRNDHIGQHSLDYLMRDLFPAWQNLASKVPLYSSWDDHDYFDNDLYGIPDGYTEEDRKNVRKVFAQSWVNPQYGFEEEEGGVFLRTRVQSADIILTDNRYFRKEGSLLGEEQMDWLKEQLLDCEGPFIILSCGTMWSDYLSDGKDSWGVFDPEGREELFSFIEDNEIGGVLLISGDRHGARGFGIPRDSGFSFYEFGAASLGGLFGPTVFKPEWATQLYGFSAVPAFGEFTFNTSGTDPTVMFRLIDENSHMLFRREFSKDELTPGK